MLGKIFNQLWRFYTVKKFFLVFGLLIFTLACNLPISQTPDATKTPDAVSTNPPTFTPAPTFTPSPTATPPKPTPVPLFFTDEFNHDLGAWTFFSTGGEQQPNAILQSDALILQMPSPHTWYYAIHTAHQYDNVFIRAKFYGEPSGAVGLVCNYSEENGWYEFNITHEGTYNLLYGQWLAEGIAAYRPLLNERSEYLQPGKFDYEIGLTCESNFVYLHINGKLFRKLDLAHIGLTEGKIGITASSYDNVPMNAVIEWFTASRAE